VFLNSGGQDIVAKGCRKERRGLQCAKDRPVRPEYVHVHGPVRFYRKLSAASRLPARNAPPSRPQFACTAFTWQRRTAFSMSATTDANPKANGQGSGRGKDRKGEECRGRAQLHEKKQRLSTSPDPSTDPPQVQLAQQPRARPRAQAAAAALLLLLRRFEQLLKAGGQLCEGGAAARAGRPAGVHDLGQPGWAVGGEGGAEAFLDHSDCRLEGGHFGIGDLVVWVCDAREEEVCRFVLQREKGNGSSAQEAGRHSRPCTAPLALPQGSSPPPTLQVSSSQITTPKLNTSARSS